MIHRLGLEYFWVNCFSIIFFRQNTNTGKFNIHHSRANPARMLKEIENAIADLKLNKSSGVDGNFYKAPLKEELVRCHREIVYNRIRRWIYVGRHPASRRRLRFVRAAFTRQPPHKTGGPPVVQGLCSGPRQAVFACEKDQFFRWRLILIQGISDHLTGVVLHKSFTQSSIDLFQSDPSSPIVVEQLDFWPFFFYRVGGISKK